MSNMFKQGKTYSRNDVWNILKVPTNKQKGDWNTGYTQYKDEFYIFATLEGPSRTGHDYDNHWNDDLFFWSAKNNSHINQPRIKALIDPLSSVHIFTRLHARIPFTYHGLGKPKKIIPEKPVKIIWEFTNPSTINVDQAWAISISNAKEFQKNKEAYSSGKTENEYKIIKATKEFITIESIRNPKVKTDLTYSLFKSVIEQLNTTKSITNLPDAMEATIVSMLPFLDWDEKSKNIFVDKTENEIVTNDSPEASNDELIKNITRQLRVRKGQYKLRRKLFQVYGNKCCISGCDIKELLHACHIIPHVQTGNNSSTNAFLLRSDLHDLFDANLIGIDPKTLTISVKKSLFHSEYYKFNGIKISDRTDELVPNIESLKHRWHLFNRSI